jgi:hypothetical protein
VLVTVLVFDHEAFGQEAPMSEVVDHVVQVKWPPFEFGSRIAIAGVVPGQLAQDWE